MDGKTSETCRVIFNKLERIVHLVGFTIEIEGYFLPYIHTIKTNIKNNEETTLRIRIFILQFVTIVSNYVKTNLFLTYYEYNFSASCAV
jgi:uncharacterized membrane protein YwzB